MYMYVYTCTYNVTYSFGLIEVLYMYTLAKKKRRHVLVSHDSDHRIVCLPPCTCTCIYTFLLLQHFEKFHEAARFYHRAIDMQVHVSYMYTASEGMV